MLQSVGVEEQLNVFSCHEVQMIKSRGRIRIRVLIEVFHLELA